jgi:hypothetical protein
MVKELIVLCVTVHLSGLLAPYVLKNIEEHRTQEQEKREAMLSRQDKLINAQSHFLDSISLVLWKWRYSYMKVTYYGTVGDTARYEDAWQEYSDTVWDLLSQIRYQATLSRRLISEEAYKELVAFYDRLVGLDNELQDLTMTENATTKTLKASNLNRRMYREVTKDIDDLLSRMASTVQMST